MDFDQANERFRELKSRHALGQLTDKDFQEQVNQLVVTDAGGREWMIGIKTGKWYVAEGNRWVQATPPGSAPEPASLPPAPPESDNRTFWLIIGVAAGALAILAMAACGIFLFLSTQGTRTSNVPPTVFVPATPTTVSVTSTSTMIAPAASPTFFIETPTGAPVPTSAVIPTATVFGPTSAATAVNARPGLYVTAFRVDADLKRAQPVTFTVTLLNAGEADTYRLFAPIYRADETKNFGETTRRTVLVPKGVSVLTLIYPGVTGINQCEKYRAKVLREEDGIFDVYKPDGTILWLDFTICP